MEKRREGFRLAMNINAIFSRLVAPLKRRVMLMISRAVITLVDDSLKLQSLQASAMPGELLEDIERFQEYGFSSVPLPGTEAVLVFPGGNREHGICVGTDDRKFRPTGLNPGETCIYDYAGNMVIIKAGEIEVKHTAKCVVNAPLVDVGSGTLEKVLNGETFQAWFNAHTHIGNLGGRTSPPIEQSIPTHLSLAVKAAKAPI